MAGWNAKRANPAIAFAEMGVRYAEEAETMEDPLDKDLKNWQSMLLIDEAVRLVKQKMAQPPIQISEAAGDGSDIGETKGNMQGLIPLLGQKGMAGGGSSQSGEDRTRNQT